MRCEGAFFVVVYTEKIKQQLRSQFKSTGSLLILDLCPVLGGVISNKSAANRIIVNASRPREIKRSGYCSNSTTPKSFDMFCLVDAAQINPH